MHPFRIFLSYSHADGAIARKMVGKLTEQSLSVHWDDRLPEVVIENNIPIYKLPATADFEILRFTT